MNAPIGQIATCCGERCKWESHPMARIFMCGREITHAETDAAKRAFIEKEQKNTSSNGAT